MRDLLNLRRAGIWVFRWRELCDGSVFVFLSVIMGPHVWAFTLPRRDSASIRDLVTRDVRVNPRFVCVQKSDP